MGPLGNGFTLPDQATKNIVVGGGLGIPPLLELSKRLGGNTEVLLGYQDIPFMAEDFHRLGINVHIASQLGNYGLHGTVCDLLESLILQQDRYLLADQDRCLSLCQHGQKNIVSRFKFLWKNGWHVALVPV